MQGYKLKVFNLLTWVISILFVVLSCGRTKRNIAVDNLPVIDISAALKNQGEMCLSEISDSISYISLETSDSCFISRSNRLVTTEKNIFIEDIPNLRILVFTRDGRFLNTIGSKGRGPGELVDLVKYIVDEKRNQVVITSYTKVAIFRYDGSLITEIKKTETTRSCQLVLPYGNDIMYFWRFPDNISDNSGYSFRVNNNGKKHGYFIRNTPSGYNTTMKFSRPFAHSVHYQKEAAVFFDLFSDTIYSINLSGKGKYPFMPSYYVKNKKVIDINDISEYGNNSIAEKWPDYFIPWDIINSDRFIIIPGFVRAINYLVLYDKSSGSTRAVLCKSIFPRGRHVAGLINDLDGGLPFYPMSGSTQGNELCMVLRPEIISQYLKVPSIGGVPGVENGNIPFKTRFSDFSMESNPVIAIVHLRKR